VAVSTAASAPAPPAVPPSRSDQKGLAKDNPFR
jgi:hypothetical protein